MRRRTDRVRLDTTGHRVLLVERGQKGNGGMRLAAAVLSALLFLGSTAASASGMAYVRLLYHGSRGAPVVALTFDDGWSATRCARILDILERRQVAATFFPVALAVSAAPAFWRRVAADGYPIANHTTTHADLTHLTLQGATDEIAGARTIIEAIIGRPLIRVVRPPYGAWDSMVLQAAAAAGFPTVLLWDTTAADTAPSSSPASMLRAALRGRNGSVVLMHCGPAVTPTILEQVIDGYEARGFGFVTVPQLLNGKVPASAFPPPTASPEPPPGDSSTPEPPAPEPPVAEGPAVDSVRVPLARPGTVWPI